jgi:glycosyltransferase involved in cell wall biosynthesis
LTLSIVIPAFNEAKTINLILTKIKSVDLIHHLQKEVVVVDDCSGDDTAGAVERFQQSNSDLAIRYLRNEKNRGKGFSLARGLKAATGDFVIVQDADLEYDPEDYNKLLKPMLENKADVVYGSRFMGGSAHRILFFWHSIGNKFLTFLSNAATNLNLTDMETGYKLFRKEIIQQISLKENRFGFEPEVTAKIARIKGIRIYEVGISYYGRTYDEGKKINWKDGLRAIYCIIKYNYFSKN